jgi:peptide/nickel transport system substrate-binding protein
MKKPASLKRPPSLRASRECARIRARRSNPGSQARAAEPGLLRCARNDGAYRPGLAAIFILLASLLTRPAFAADSQNCGTIVIPTGVGVSSSEDITSFNPLLVDSLYNQEAASLLYEQLIWINGNKQIDWSRSVASAVTTRDQGQTYNITLRPWFWSDGAPVTASDVAYTFNLIKQLGSTFPGYGSGGMPDIIKSLTVTDAAHLTVTLAHRVNPTWFIYNGLAQLVPLPSHAWSRYTLDEIWQNQSTPAFFTVDDGPLKLEKLEPGLDAIFLPNPTYQGAKIHFTRLVMRFLDADGAELQGVESGDLDLANLPMALYASAQHVPGITNIPVPPASGWNYMQLNFRDPDVAFLNDVRVRQAMQDAMDQQAMINLAFHGQGEPDYGPVPQNPPDMLSPAMKAGKFPVGYNPQKARALLAQAGYTPGPDGIMQKNGKKLQFTDLMLTGDATIEQMTEMLQNDLRAVGIDMKVREIEFNQVLALLNGSPQGWQTATLSMTLSSYPSGEGMFTTAGFFNSGGYSDKTMDKLIDESVNNPGLDGLYAFEDYASAQQPVLFMASGDIIIMTRNRIHGVENFVDSTDQYYPDALYCAAPKAPTA